MDYKLLQLILLLLCCMIIGYIIWHIIYIIIYKFGLVGKYSISGNMLKPIYNLDIKYYQHPNYNINSITKIVLDKLNIKKTTDMLDNWILYIPKNYNYIELELIEVNPTNTNQIIYAIKGCDSLCSKNQLWTILHTYYGRSKTSKLIPESYSLNDKLDITYFRNKYLHNDNNSNNNSNNSNITPFILKKNIQGKKGLMLVNNALDALNNGKADGYKVIQLYIYNPFTINKRKLNIRLYVIIICHLEKVEWLLYDKGKCLYTNKRYNITSSLNDENINDKEQHFTSLNVDNNKIYLDEKLPESLLDLNNMLGNTVYTRLITNIISILKDVKNAYKSKLGNLPVLRNNKCFQLFGLDFILDDNMTPYLLEFNKGPAMSIKSPKDKQLKETLICDIFEYVLLNKDNNKDNNAFIIL